MEINKLEQYVLALKTVSEKIKTYQGPMEPSSGVITDDMIGTNGYHSALISIVARDLPGLQECYDRIQKRGGWEYSKDLKQVYYYSYNHWADALALYLGFPFDEVTYVHTSLRKSLCDWAAEHEEIWDNIHGKDMFSLDKSGAAFGGYGERFPYLIIIDYWSGVFDRLKVELARLEEEDELARLVEKAKLDSYMLQKKRLREAEKTRVEAVANRGRLELLDRMQERLLREEAADKKAIKQLTGIVVFIVIVLVAIYMYTNNYTI